MNLCDRLTKTVTKENANEINRLSRKQVDINENSSHLGVSMEKD
jgi:hypothetical protein